MIIDTSAIVAVATGEDERADFLRLMAAAPVRRLSTGTWIELNAVAVRSRVVSVKWLDAALDRLRLVIEPVTVDQASLGRDAYRRYGIGSGGKAKLNFGDCFAYALAKSFAEPLLFKGDDFTHTDVIRAA